MIADSSCNVAGCDHTRPEECEVVRCATCNEPYDGTEAAAAHIARAHLDILARDRRAARVRTQAERATDDHTWRPMPDEPTPALLLTITSPVTLDELAQIKERFTQRSGRPVHLTASLEITRRRWWHQLTRRNP